MGLLAFFRKKPANAQPNGEDNALTEIHADISQMDAVELPMAQIAAFGGGMATMLSSLHAVTNSMSDGNLYRCVFPKGVNGCLATAHGDGLNIGTIINEKGIVGQARWVKEKPQSALMAISPAMLAMAAALAAIEKKLDAVLGMEKQILSFLEEDKEAKIEGDWKTLTTILQEYKYNWDNATYTAAQYQIAADIRRDAEANMIFYQKQIADMLKENHGFIMWQFVSSTQAALTRKFQYYRLSFDLFCFASVLEVMLQRQYEEGYIQQVQQGIHERADKYREVYKACANHLERLAESSVEYQVLKGLGTAGQAVGNFVSSIPVMKNGQVDEWFLANGKQLEQSGENFSKEMLNTFQAISEPNCDMFADSLADVNRFFNQTREIYIGKNSIYFVKNAD